MKLEVAISKLKAQQSILRSRGVKHLSIFGSLAKGITSRDSDIDIAVKLDYDMGLGLVEFANIRRLLSQILETDVDLVSEPVRSKPRLQAEIDNHRVTAF